MTVCRRDAREAGRLVRRALSATTAAQAIGPITPGCEIFGLSKGQFSLVDIVEHVVTATGPSDVTIATWTAGGVDLGLVQGLVQQGGIRSLRFVVDFSFPSRQPAHCAALRARFGDGCIRITKVHAKFVVVRNDTWSVVIRSSMNLNENRRLESFEISDDYRLADYLDATMSELFGAFEPGRQFDLTPYENVQAFERFGEHETPSAPLEADDKDRRRYFQNGPAGVDLRRVGWSTDRGTVIK